MSSLPDVAPSIEISHLNYNFADGSTALSDVSFSLPPGSRTLLIGANGAGKTTLLRLMSGKRLSPRGTVLIGGVDPFTTGLEGVTYLGMEWVLNPIVRNDIAVSELLASVGGSAYPDRRDELVKILDIDVDWHMHTVSDGERRRVQLAMGLVRPWSVLLLDEVTVDLDVLARNRFLAFLKQETEKRECTVVYATHILESAGDWATHVARVVLGRVRWCGEMTEVLEQGAKRKGVEKVGLLEVVLEWLEEDLVERGPRGKNDSEYKTYADLQKIE